MQQSDVGHNVSFGVNFPVLQLHTLYSHVQAFLHTLIYSLIVLIVEHEN